MSWHASIEECLCIPVDYLAAETVPCPSCFPHRATGRMCIEGDGFYCPTCERTWDDDELREAIDARLEDEPAWAESEAA